MATKKEKLERLGAVPFFSGLSKRDLERILVKSQEVQFSEGQNVVTEGKDGVGFHLILEGTANVIRNGRKAVTLGVGEFFGEMAVVDSAARTASVVATSPLTTVTMSSWEFRPLVKNNPEMAWKLIEYLVSRLREEQKGRDALLR